MMEKYGLLKKKLYSPEWEWALESWHRAETQKQGYISNKLPGGPKAGDVKGVAASS